MEEQSVILNEESIVIVFSSILDNPNILFLDVLIANEFIIFEKYQLMDDLFVSYLLKKIVLAESKFSVQPANKEFTQLLTQNPDFIYLIKNEEVFLVSKDTMDTLDAESLINNLTEM